MRRPPSSPIFPYATLFRSLEEPPGSALLQLLREGHGPAGPLRITARAVAAFNQDDVGNAALARSSLAVQLGELRRGADHVAGAAAEPAPPGRAISAPLAAGRAGEGPPPPHRGSKHAPRFF